MVILKRERLWILCEFVENTVSATTINILCYPIVGPIAALETINFFQTDLSVGKEEISLKFNFSNNSQVSYSKNKLSACFYFAGRLILKGSLKPVDKCMCCGKNWNLRFQHPKNFQHSNQFLYNTYFWNLLILKLSYRFSRSAKGDSNARYQLSNSRIRK